MTTRIRGIDFPRYRHLLFRCRQTDSLRQSYGENSLKLHGRRTYPRDPKGSLDFARDFACGLKRPQDGSTSTRTSLRKLRVVLAQEDRGILYSAKLRHYPRNVILIISAPTHKNPALRREICITS